METKDQSMDQVRAQYAMDEVELYPETIAFPLGST
jgi:hypothetical protein